jgi:hypothetical protein
MDALDAAAVDGTGDARGEAQLPQSLTPLIETFLALPVDDAAAPLAPRADLRDALACLPLALADERAHIEREAAVETLAGIFAIANNDARDGGNALGEVRRDHDGADRPSRRPLNAAWAAEHHRRRAAAAFVLDARDAKDAAQPAAPRFGETSAAAAAAASAAAAAPARRAFGKSPKLVDALLAEKGYRLVRRSKHYVYKRVAPDGTTQTFVRSSTSSSRNIVRAQLGTLRRL